MLLRRITKHVKDQNWFAVLIDFFIVVLGVFIGMQVANWNDARASKQATISVLERLNAEIDTNMDAADNVIARIDESADIRAVAISALEACDPSDAARTSVTNAIGVMTGDILPPLLNNITQDLARQDRYTQFLSDGFLTELNIYDGHISDEAEQLAINFGIMWDEHVRKNPMVGVTLQSESAFGDYTLAEPVDVLCNDTVFSRQFIMTNIWHIGFQMRLTRFKARSETFRATLQTELEALN